MLSSPSQLQAFLHCSPEACTHSTGCPPAGLAGPAASHPSGPAAIAAQPPAASKSPARLRWPLQTLLQTPSCMPQRGRAVRTAEHGIYGWATPALSLRAGRQDVIAGAWPGSDCPSNRRVRMQPGSPPSTCCAALQLCIFGRRKRFASPAGPGQGQSCTHPASVTAHPLCCIADVAMLCALTMTLVVDARRPVVAPIASAAGSSTVERSLAWILSNSCLTCTSRGHLVTCRAAKARQLLAGRSLVSVSG